MQATTVVLLAALACLPGAHMSWDDWDPVGRDFILNMLGVVVNSDTDNEYIKIPGLEVEFFYKCSRLNGSIIIKKNLPCNTMMTITTYRHMPAMTPNPPLGPMKLCDFLKEEQIDMKPIWEASNFPRKCPVRKGAIIFNNFTDFSPLFRRPFYSKWSDDAYSINFKMTIDSKDILDFTLTFLKVVAEVPQPCYDPDYVYDDGLDDDDDY